MSRPIQWSQSWATSDMPHTWEGRTADAKRYVLEKVSPRTQAWLVYGPAGERLCPPVKTAKDGKAVCQEHYDKSTKAA